MNPNSKVGEHTRPGGCWTRLASQPVASVTDTEVSEILARPMFSARAPENWRTRRRVRLPINFGIQVEAEQPPCSSGNTQTVSPSAS